jgi:hypothetical protein
VTTFSDKTLSEYIQKKGGRNHHIQDSIPISHPDPESVELEDILQLYLEKEAMHKQSYIRLKHIYQVPISSLCQNKKHKFPAYRLRLSQASYNILTQKLGITPDYFEETDTIRASAPRRLRLLAQAQAPATAPTPTPELSRTSLHPAPSPQLHNIRPNDIRPNYTPPARILPRPQYTPVREPLLEQYNPPIRQYPATPSPYLNNNHPNHFRPNYTPAGIPPRPQYMPVREPTIGQYPTPDPHDDGCSFMAGCLKVLATVAVVSFVVWIYFK